MTLSKERDDTRNLAITPPGITKKALNDSLGDEENKSLTEEDEFLTWNLKRFSLFQKAFTDGSFFEQLKSMPCLDFNVDLWVNEYDLEEMLPYLGVLTSEQRFKNAKGISTSD